MPRPLPLPHTVFAIDPKMLSESYSQFDRLINKFGPERGKYLAALPGSKNYRKLIADDLIRQLGPQSGNYLRARVKLLPQGVKHSPYFYPFENIETSESTYISAAEKALSESRVHYLLIRDDSGETNIDPNEIITNEVQIFAEYGNQASVISKICQLLDPIINMHDVLHYVDPYFSIRGNEYVPLWQEIFSQLKGKKTIHIHTEILFTISEFTTIFGEYIPSSVSVEMHLYETDRRNHDRLFVGDFGGWRSGRGFKLSNADTILLDCTAIGPGNGGVKSRLEYLNDIPKTHFIYNQCPH